MNLLAHRTWGPWLLVIVAALGLPAQAQVDPRYATPDWKRFDVGGGFAGHVVRGSSALIEGAYVEVRPLESGAIRARDFEGPPTKWQWTGPDGTFQLNDLPPGTWVLTAVVGPPGLDEVALRDLSRRHAAGEWHEEAGVSRFIRHLGGHAGSATHNVSVAVEPRPRPDDVFRGKLTGAFDPERFAYTASFVISTDAGETVSSTTVDGITRSVVSISGPLIQPWFSSAVRSDGTFELATLAGRAFQSLNIHAIPLDGSGSSATAAAWHGQPTRGDDVRADELHEIELAPRRLLRFRLRGLPEEDRNQRPWERRRPSVTLHDEAGGSMGPTLPPHGPRDLLQGWCNVGSYVMQATAEGYASPLQALIVEPSDEPLDLELTLAPCPPYTLKVGYSPTVPAKSGFMYLGPAETLGIEDPCRIHVVCQQGFIEFRNVLPGDYFLEWPYERPRTRSLVTLGPDVGKVILEP